MKLDPAVAKEWIPKSGRDKIDPRIVAEDRVNDNLDIVNGWFN